jgi:hypothetical protein
MAPNLITDHPSTTCSSLNNFNTSVPVTILETLRVSFGQGLSACNPASITITDAVMCSA